MIKRAILEHRNYGQQSNELNPIGDGSSTGRKRNVLQSLKQGASEYRAQAEAIQKENQLAGKV